MPHWGIVPTAQELDALAGSAAAGRRGVRDDGPAHPTRIG